jgi:superfamily I DNA and RNA helicase
MPEGIKVSYRARENYRSPYKIARYIQRQFPEFEFEPANGVVGLDMAQYSVADEGHQLSKVEKIVASLLQRGLRAADIVILSCRHATQSVFHRVTALGGLPLRHIAPDRDGDADVVDAMRFAGVTDFMGQEAAAVILVDVDLEPGEQLESRRRTAFSGMTRATLRLDIVNVPPQAHDHGAR